MDQLNNIREILLDQEKFVDMASQFVLRALEEEKTTGDENFERFYSIAVETIVRQTSQTVFEFSESPIETIFLNSLLLGSIKADALFLVVHQTHKNTNREINEFRGDLKNLKDFLRWYKNKNDSYQNVELFLDNEIEKGKMSTGEREYIRNLMFRYHYLPLEDSFHLTIQPKFPDIEVAGKTIRPDLYFWIPKCPEFNVVVECDSFQYHSNKESFIKDRKRDRVLLSKGFQVLRYSGSEIFRNPPQVAADIMNFLWSASHDNEEQQPHCP